MQSTMDSLMHLDSPTWYNLGTYSHLVESGLEALRDQDAASRIWGRDGTLWKRDQMAAAEIENRLGWLELPASMAVDVPRLRALAVELQAAGTLRVVLLGMGGSSLAPEVMRRVLGVAPDYIELAVLDTTDPSQIRRILGEVPVSRTLFLVASKSGTTAETLSLYAYCRAAVTQEAGEEHWAKHFVAITDPGTSLEELARNEGFRAVYLNPPDIGGRFSALSLFGLVPAAIMGIDLDRLLHRAKEMAWACRSTAPAQQNPGLVLGTILGELAIHPSHPHDKLTLLTSAELAPFGAWAEQLIAESTGKEGRGILPVVGKPLGQATYYGTDRLFVYLRLDGAHNGESDARADALVRAGHPLVALQLTDLYDLGAEFFRWEFATAVAALRLGINPFDQRDVESAKARSRKALAHYEESRTLPQESPVHQEGRLTFYGPDYRSDSASGHLRAFLSQAEPGDYVALLAYLDRSTAHDLPLQEMRQALATALRLAATVGYGPRYLHSTGQLHKGGRNTGLFIQITQDESDDLAIPGRAYTFGILKRAQALGDLQALREAQRRVLRVNVGAAVEAGLAELSGALEGALQ